MNFVRYSSDNSIQAAADWPAPGMVQVEFEVVRGYDGKLYRKGEEPVKTDEEIAAGLAAEARAKRNALIAETDYMAMPDYPLDDEKKAAVLAYRQALRDVPEQAGFPRQIDWPVKP